MCLVRGLPGPYKADQKDHLVVYTVIHGLVEIWLRRNTVVQDLQVQLAAWNQLLGLSHQLFGDESSL